MVSIIHPLHLCISAAGSWGMTSMLLPGSLANQPVIYLQWEFNRTGNGGFFKMDDVKIIAHDFCASPVIFHQPVSAVSACIGNSISSFDVTALGSGQIFHINGRKNNADIQTDLLLQEHNQRHCLLLFLILDSMAGITVV